MLPKMTLSHVWSNLQFRRMYPILIQVDDQNRGNVWQQSGAPGARGLPAVGSDKHPIVGMFTQAYLSLRLAEINWNQPGREHDKYCHTLLPKCCRSFKAEEDILRDDQDFDCSMIDQPTKLCYGPRSVLILDYEEQQVSLSYPGLVSVCQALFTGKQILNDMKNEYKTQRFIGTYLYPIYTIETVLVSFILYVQFMGKQIARLRDSQLIEFPVCTLILKYVPQSYL